MEKDDAPVSLSERSWRRDGNNTGNCSRRNDAERREQSEADGVRGERRDRSRYWFRTVPGMADYLEVLLAGVPR